MIPNGVTHTRLIECGLPDDVGSLDQFVRSIAASMGWTENMVEQSCCKFGRHLANKERSQFFDAQYSTQKTYEVNLNTNELVCYWFGNGQLMSKSLPVHEFAWQPGTQKFRLGPAIWDLKTPKRALGKGKRRSARDDGPVAQVTNLKAMDELPSRLTLAQMNPSNMKAMHFRQLLATACGDNTVKKCCIHVHRKSRPVKHVVPIVRLEGRPEVVSLQHCYSIGMEAKRAAILKLVLGRSPSILKNRLIKALQQMKSKELNQETYYPNKTERRKMEHQKRWVAFYDVDQSKKNKREAMAVALLHRPRKTWLALVDEHYMTDKMNVVQL